MRRCLLATAVLTAGMSALQPVWGAEEILPKAEVILDKFVDATGGKAAYDKLYNAVIKGTVEFVGLGVKGSLTGYHAEPNKAYTSAELQGMGRIEEGNDGLVAWTQSAMEGPRVKQGDERATALRQANFHSQTRWRELFKKVETQGIETIGEQSYYKVLLTPSEGSPETHYYDTKTHLLTRSTMILKSPMGEIPIDSSYGDYKRVQGVLVAHSIRQKVMNQELQITIESSQFNTEIPKDRFDLPPDIKALVEKAKAPGK
jgi:hypothetical protein